ncbi:SDR family NAD(P)-dependent oxidoreductase [Mongoliitalea daihaiensis]|uniref:SDR family NAD(P)-dependent oxidoreductase n=1 Tax=Mongoliitalea daihaiensis TaxID=2782006 RepID=UPI001F23E695|nr:SDR family NAD(P)-dependent oxidoreductase [Mongoliitalea daihaiensis]UJP64120.1 SDR family NAD(P)-dependent oxidoreductase [Mongoliitalea daihaiensis]
MTLAITGPTSGIGEETLKALVKSFDEILILARNERKATEMIKSFPTSIQPKMRFVQIDLSDLKSVQRASEAILASTSQLDVLINNAGGIFQKKEITVDGLELSFAANHLGHFLLTENLIPLLLKSKNPKVINLSSEAHRAAKIDFENLAQCQNGYSSFTAYANAKLCNILFAKSLVDKYGDKGLHAYALHPGVVKTRFGNEAGGIFKFMWKLAEPFMITAAKGAATSIYLASQDISPKFNGYYFKNSKPNTPTSTARSKEVRDKLWDLSEQLIQKLLNSPAK